jgi:hypothetical protein
MKIDPAMVEIAEAAERDARAEIAAELESAARCTNICLSDTVATETLDNGASENLQPWQEVNCTTGGFPSGGERERDRERRRESHARSCTWAATVTKTGGGGSRCGSSYPTTRVPRSRSRSKKHVRPAARACARAVRERRPAARRPVAADVPTVAARNFRGVAGPRCAATTANALGLAATRLERAPGTYEFSAPHGRIEPPAALTTFARLVAAST